MQKIQEAIEAIRAHTVEGPVRERAIAALAQVDGSGKGFKLFLEGTRRQADATLKALREAGIIQTVAKPRPGVKAVHVATDSYTDEVCDATADEVRSDAKGVQNAHAYSYQPSEWAPSFAYEEGMRLIEAPGYTPPGEDVFKKLRAKATAAGVESEGKLGDAVDTVLWSLAIFPAGLTFEDFSLEGAQGSFSKRTLETAIAALKAASMLEVIGTGRQPRLYCLAGE